LRMNTAMEGEGYSMRIQARLARMAVVAGAWRITGLGFRRSRRSSDLLLDQIVVARYRAGEIGSMRPRNCCVLEMDGWPTIALESFLPFAYVWSSWCSRWPQIWNCSPNGQRTWRWFNLIWLDVVREHKKMAVSAELHGRSQACGGP